MEKSKSQIIIRLLKQVYNLFDELTLQNDKLIKENKSLSNTVENLRNELKILRNGTR